MSKLYKVDKELTKITMAFIAEDQKRKHDELVNAIKNNPKEWQEYLRHGYIYK